MVAGGDGVGGVGRGWGLWWAPGGPVQGEVEMNFIPAFPKNPNVNFLAAFLCVPPHPHPPNALAIYALLSLQMPLCKMQ